MCRQRAEYTLIFSWMARQIYITCRLVSETIRPLDAGRKCFHLINGVLVERTVGDVLPVVDQNRESVREARASKR